MKTSAMRPLAMKLTWLLVCLALAALPAMADTARIVQVDFSNPHLSPSHWTLVIHPDGTAHFHSERGTLPPPDNSPPYIEPGNLDRDVHLSEPFAERLFQGVHHRAIVAGECESHLNVAFQGLKKISYTGPEGTWSCEFNYSRDKQVQDLGDSLMAVAGTIIEGARLEMLLQHDRLGLDHETEYLMDGAGDGRLMELCTIQGILERLAGDDSVLARVRKRARTLLAKIEK
jgi:hypothetical protein